MVDLELTATLSSARSGQATNQDRRPPAQVSCANMLLLHTVYLGNTACRTTTVVVTLCKLTHGRHTLIAASDKMLSDVQNMVHDMSVQFYDDGHLTVQHD